MWRNGAATKSKNMTWESSNGDFPHAHTAAVIFSSRSAAKPPGTSGGLCTKKFSTKRQQYLPLMQKKLPRRPNPFSPPFCRCRAWHSLSFSLPVFPPQKISYPHVTTSGRKNPHGFCPFPSAFAKTKAAVPPTHFKPHYGSLVQRELAAKPPEGLSVRFSIYKNPPDSADRFSQRHRYFGKIKIPDR